jgi:plastocyanin
MRHAALFVLMVACGGKPSATVDPNAPAIASVEVSGASAALASIDATAQLSAAAKDSSGATILGVTFAWSSSDIAIASVNTNGLVTAKGNGSATITASAGGKSGTRGVTVRQAVASVAVSPPTAAVAVAGTQIFDAQPRDAGGAAIAGLGPPVWISSDTTVATLAPNADGTATATGKSNGGPITITATISSTSGTAQLTVDSTSVTHSLSWFHGNTTANLTIKAHDSVKWNIADGACHNSASCSSTPAPSGCPPASGFAWDTGVRCGGTLGPVTFNTPGTYVYCCTPHTCGSMQGTITVQ